MQRAVCALLFDAGLRRTSSRTALKGLVKEAGLEMAIAEQGGNLSQVGIPRSCYPAISCYTYSPLALFGVTKRPVARVSDSYCALPGHLGA